MSIDIDFEMDTDFVPTTHARCTVCKDSLEGWEMATGICILCECLEV
jgi:hypothetical protein